MRSNGDWVTPLRISPQTYTALSYSVGLSLQWIDDLDISRESTGIPQNHHLGTIDRRITPDICISGWSARVEIYLLPLGAKLIFMKIVC